MASGHDDWERVYLTEQPVASGQELDATETQLLTTCRRYWDKKQIPVVAWGCEHDGLELFPPTAH